MSGFFVNGFSFDHKSLANIGEFQIVVELAAYPDSAGFDTTMTLVDRGGGRYFSVIIKTR